METLNNDKLALKIMAVARGDVSLSPNSGALVVPIEGGDAVTLASHDGRGFTITPGGAAWILDCWAETFTPRECRYFKNVCGRL